MIGGLVIASPIPGMADLHLLERADNAVGDSLLYVPFSNEPALATDVIRVDRLPQSPLTLADWLQAWLAQYAKFAGGCQVEFTRLEASDQLLFHAGFKNHPIIGAHQTAMRYLRGVGRDYAIQFIRKRRGVPQIELRHRLDFLAACKLGPQTFAPVVPKYSEYAARVHEQSEKLSALMRHPAERLKTLPIEELRSLLVGASPFREELLWANLARYYGRTALNDGKIDEFEKAAECLECALVTLHDSREVEALAELLYATTSNLAELLMYTYGSSRAENIFRAVALYRILADHWRASHPADALNADIMAGFGWLLSHPESQQPLDSGFSKATQLALKRKEQTVAAVESLHSYSNRMAYVARNKERPLYNDACLAADLAQLILERAQIDGKFGTVEHSGLLIEAFRDQINAQLGFYGLTQDDLDRNNQEFTRRFRQPERDVPRLLFLRPLAASRRVMLQNRFGEYYGNQLSPLIPATLPLEAALQIALVRGFNTIALGGPIDIFGMARETGTGGKSSDPLRSWQKAASLLIQYSEAILLLFNDSEGLRWEISEIAHQSAFSKLVFVLPPADANQQMQGYTDETLQWLRERGLNLPGGIRKPGFVLIGEQGEVHRELSFDALWTGELFEALLPNRQDSSSA